MELARGPRYPAARIAAQRVHPHFARVQESGRSALPDVQAIEDLIDAAFWTSLRREEGYSPKISLAFLPPEYAGAALTFEWPLGLTPEALGRLAPAAERPGVHLGVWREDDSLRVWGTTRSIPPFCFVLEVLAPGLLVLKYRRSEESAKFVNVAVLEGDQVKVLDAEAPNLPGCPSLVSSLLGFDGPGPEDPVNVLVELAVSMRAHGRGGALLVVPADSDAWRESIRQPIHYSVAPKFARIRELMEEEPAAREQQRWRDAFHRTIEAIAGLTAVDGATVMSERYEVLAFGAKIRRREDCASVEHVILTEPIEGAAPQTVPSLQTGGTRHLSAAQFAHDQRDAMALVASQDGRFTAFAWSECDGMVRAHRVETLLL